MTPPGAATADAAIRSFLTLVYADRVDVARLAAAADVIAVQRAVTTISPAIACAFGDAGAVRAHLAEDMRFALRPLDPLGMPPLVAVTHSGYLRVDERAPALRECARLLLAHGAHADASWRDERFANPLTALYGAAAKHADAELTRLLLDAGADPNDGETLYHSITHADPACARLVLERGARVSGTNALFRVLDVDRLTNLELLLAHGADPNESGPMGLSPLLWAIRRRRSRAHIEALLAAGADPTVCAHDGASAAAWAMRFGLPDVAKRLVPAQTFDPVEEFVAACASANRADAESVLRQHPDVTARLTAWHYRVLPELAAARAHDGVRVLVDMGWPIDARGGDWDASALNHAVFWGDAELADFLLAHGAHWSERHGYNDTVVGTLSYASVERPREDGDWLACARALVAHGMPAPPETYDFSADVTAYFASLRGG